MLPTRYTLTNSRIDILMKPEFSDVSIGRDCSFHPENLEGKDIGGGVSPR